MKIGRRGVLLVATAACTYAAPVRFDVLPEKSVIAVRTGKAGLLSAFGAGHRHGIIAGEFSARICADPRALESGKVSIRIPVASLRIDSMEARRAAGLTESGPDSKDVTAIQKKLVSAANLDAAGHPEIRFESVAVERTPEGVKVNGSLTIRDKTKPMTVVLRVQQTGGDYRFTGEFDVKLREYEITPESVGGVVKVADDVKVLLDLMTRPQAEPCR